jgi:putative ubiquitin-RnfH superfamily antitoxin RatB of RatAB toxin-antitoxin module
MTDDAAARMVEVAAGTAERQVVIAVAWQPGLTAGEALERSRIREALPEIAALPLVLGRFGQPIDAHTVLEPGDRIDFCRPLVKDPRDMRRELLSAGNVMGRGKPWAGSPETSRESKS